MFATKPYPDPRCYNNHMTRTGLWFEARNIWDNEALANLMTISCKWIKVGLQYKINSCIDTISINRKINLLGGGGSVVKDSNPPACSYPSVTRCIWKINTVNLHGFLFFWLRVDLHLITWDGKKKEENVNDVHNLSEDQGALSSWEECVFEFHYDPS